MLTYSGCSDINKQELLDVKHELGVHFLRRKNRVQVFVLFITISFLYVSCASFGEESISLRSGTYESYFQSEIENGYTPGINTIYADGTGYFELSIGKCAVYIEEYQWEIHEDMLIVRNLRSYTYDPCKDAVLEVYESYTQYFEILNYTPSVIEMTLRKDVYADGTEEYFDYPESYFWEYAGSQENH
jgi:hypothetical protein